MAEDAPKYYAVLTDSGAALEARALAEGKGIVLTHIAVGDANQETVTPDPAVTQLVHEVHRRPIDARSRDENDPKVTLLHATIPADVGGFWINELGVVGHLEGEEEEVLYAYANHGRYYKMLPQDGQTITHELTIPVVQSTDARIVIEVADDGYATRQEYLLLAALVESLRTIRRACWTLDVDVAEGADLPLPEGISYIPGHNAVQLSCDGLVCHIGQQFDELPAAQDGRARALRLHFTAVRGCVLEVFVAGHSSLPPLYDEPVSGNALATRIAALEQQLSRVSGSAVYLGDPPVDNL